MRHECRITVMETKVSLNIRRCSTDYFFDRPFWQVLISFQSPNHRFSFFRTIYGRPFALIAAVFLLWSNKRLSYATLVFRAVRIVRKPVK